MNKIKRQLFEEALEIDLTLNDLQIKRVVCHVTGLKERVNQYQAYEEI